jgi:cysteinyl-tRNA synthetase
MRNNFHALAQDASAQPDANATERFTGFVNDDLNVPRALAVAWEVVRGDLPDPVKRASLARFDDVFGLGLLEWQPKAEQIPDDVRALADRRAAARKAKSWKEADRLRAELHARGWEMEDRPDGYTLKRR